MVVLLRRLCPKPDQGYVKCIIYTATLSSFCNGDRDNNNVTEKINDWRDNFMIVMTMVVRVMV